MAIKELATGWMQLFIQRRMPTMFLQSFFTVKPGNIYNGAKVQIDVQRFGEQIAVVIKRGTGANLNDYTDYTNKEFEPPVYGEGFNARVEELVERMAGVDKYSSAYLEYGQKLVSELMLGYEVVDAKITRSVELQAAQILQTGKLDLLEREGGRFLVDFFPKATHFPTVSVDWDNAASTKLADLEALAKVVRKDGKVNPNVLIFGEQAINDFVDDDAVQKRADIRRFDDMVRINPMLEASGATRYGSCVIGSYRFEMWTYPEYYEDPETGDLLPYVDADKVIMLSTNTRLDRTSARVPLPLGPDPRVASLMPGRLTNRSQNLDVTPNLYCSNDGKSITGDLESRTLLVPVQIDGFGALKTRA